MIDVARCPIHFDPTDPEQRADPVPTYRRLRAEAPVHYEVRFDLWVVTRYADVNAVIRDTETFSSEGAVTSAAAPLPERARAKLAEGHWPVTLLTQSDDPLHRTLRNLVQRAFTPRRVAALEPAIRERAQQLAGRFGDRGEADVVGEFAWELPIYVVGRMIGVPDGDVPKLHEWSDDLMMVLQATATPDELERHAAGVVAMQRYFAAALEDRLSARRDDLMSSLLADWEPELVPFEQVAQLPLNLIVAGHLTVTRAIGNGIWMLAGDPELARRLRTDTDAMGPFVEELLRLEAPAQGLFRTVTRDTELAGVRIPAGARVMIQFGAANHDESVFEEPDAVRLERANMSQHLAFGKGAHFCVGAPLARLELPVAFETLLAALPGLRRTDVEPVRDPVFFARGFRELRVAWDPVGSA